LTGVLRAASSVRVRLTVAVTIIFGVALSASALGLVRQVESALVNDVKVRNETVTRALAQLLSTGRVSPDGLSLNSRDIDTELSGEYDPDVVREGISGSYIYATGPALGSSAGDDQSVWSRMKSAVASAATPLFGKVMPGQLSDDRFVISRTRIATPYGSMVLNVASPLDSINRTVHRIAAALFVAVPSLVALVGAMAWFMTGRALRPVDAITSRVKAITGSTLHERVPEPRTDDEIGELARTMNAMLDRLEGSSERQKRFMSDASHELRSPVASIKTQLETALIASDDTDWESVAHTVLAEDERLESLVGTLLAMARLEEGVRGTPTEVDLDEVVFDQTSRPARVAVDRSHVGAGRVRGIPTELGSVVRNLFDNAARHAESQVSISVSTIGPWVRLAVDDDGPGVAAEDRAKVFERFARLQEGRARDSGGSGLGLALCKRIVESHGGRIFVESSELGGASFVVELPAALLSSATGDEPGPEMDPGAEPGAEPTPVA
jgi:signal transduction histidine kinase